MRKKVSVLQLSLTLLFVVTFLISNIVVFKQISLPFGIVMTGAVVLFPITYVLSDIFSEVYGYKWSRFTCYCAFIANILMVVAFELIIALPQADTFTNQESFELVLGSSFKVLVASLTAYVIGDLVNDRIFRKLKNKQNNKFEVRAIASSFCGEFVDSLIFIPIVFGSILPFTDVMLMILIQPTIKVLYEIVVLPITKVVVFAINRFESKGDLSE